MADNPNIIEIRKLATYLGSKWVNKDLDMDVRRGEVLGIAGGSGSGKTTLLREMLWLQKPTAGQITVCDLELTTAKERDLLALQQRFGVLFQQNALFSSLTILENVAFPLKEHTKLSAKLINELALLKILMVGLGAEVADQYPSELSGGMEKRAALARALVLDPEIIFLDEPSAGLDPKSAQGIDELIMDLQETMGLTIVIITHDLDSLWRITDRVAFLGEGKVLCIDEIAKLVENPHPEIKAFFKGPRGRAAQGASNSKPRNVD